MSKIREKESLECGRMHIWALKTQNLPGPLSGPWTPAANCSLRYVCNFRPQHLGPPPWPNPGSAPGVSPTWGFLEWHNKHKCYSEMKLTPGFNNKLKDTTPVRRMGLWASYFQQRLPKNYVRTRLKIYRKQKGTRTNILIGKFENNTSQNVT